MEVTVQPTLSNKKKGKTFILGVGAKKAGTSWLHSYIKKNKNADLGFTKEYHIWDALTQPEFKKLQETLSFPLNSVQTRRWIMQKFEWYYFYYFRSLLNSNGINITADITPNYSGLDRKTLFKIKINFERYGIDTKVVFLMRDPVDRCLSNVAMDKKLGRLPEANNHHRAAARYYKTNGYISLTRYEKTITELESVFSANNLYFGIYEEMFETENIVSLSEFLGVNVDIDFKNEIINASPKLSFDERTKGDIASYYNETYTFVADRFPQTEQLWGGFRYI